MTDISEHGSASANRTSSRTGRQMLRVLPTLLILGYLAEVNARLLLGAGDWLRTSTRTRLVCWWRLAVGGPVDYWWFGCCQWS